MAALVVQSRFAGLKIEDDDYPSSNDTRQQSKIKEKKTNGVKKMDQQKKIKNNNNNIHNSKPQTGLKKKKPKQNVSGPEQWESWKQKDEELVDGNFESELQQAILLSKLDYEEKKDVYKQFKKESDVQKKLNVQVSRTNCKKQKKKNVMSLEQFNDMVNSGEDAQSLNNVHDKDDSGDLKIPEKDTEFFERVKDETKTELLKDKNNDRVRIRQMASDEIITRVQFADALERKDKEINSLKQEVQRLKEELLTVKTRNKKLCGILGQGEMKDKAQVLVEVERLRAVQTELTAEIATLHTDLERERSRNTDPRAKDKKYPTKKKNIRFDVSSEALLTKESCSGNG